MCRTCNQKHQIYKGDSMLTTNLDDSCSSGSGCVYFYLSQLTVGVFTYFYVSLLVVGVFTYSYVPQ